MHPANWALYIKESVVQTIPVSEVYRGHSRASPPIITLVIRSNLVPPELANITSNIFTKSNID